MGESEMAVVAEKVDVLVRLLALSLVEGKTRRQQIVLLSRAGMQPKEIAAMIGTTRNTVSVELSKHRRQVRKEPNKQGKATI